MKEKVQIFVTGELSENEHKKVFDWISAHEGNRQYYDGLRAALRAAEYYRSEKQYDIEKVRARLHKRIELAGDGRRTDYRILFRIAASLLLLLTSYIVIRSISNYKSAQAEGIIYNTIESPFGSRARVYLPDSTYVVLNAGSTLKYPADFTGRARREVILNGEGFFEVRESQGSEFVVSVGDIRITALGTAFNVKAYPEEAQIEATLVEGLLRINQGDDQKGAITLRPNEKISIIKKDNEVISIPAGTISGHGPVRAQPEHIPIREVRVDKKIEPAPEISWKDTEWVIRGTTMEELSVMLERRYDVKIILGDEEIGDLSFSGTLKDETLEQVLHAIRSTAPVDYEIDGKKVVFTLNTFLRKRYGSMLKEKSSPN